MWCTSCGVRGSGSAGTSELLVGVGIGKAEEFLGRIVSGKVEVGPKN